MLTRHYCLRRSPSLLREMVQGRLIPPLLPVQTAASGGATRAAVPTIDEWFDPGTIKEKRDSRLNAASSTPTAASSPTPLRRPRSRVAEGTSKAPTQGRLLQSIRT